MSANLIPTLLTPYSLTATNTMNLVDSVLGTPRKNEDEETTVTATAMADDENMIVDEELQVRTMDVPRWLGTPEVTSKFCCEIKYVSMGVDYC